MDRHGRATATRAPDEREAAYGDNFRLEPDETLADVLARYEDVAVQHRGGDHSGSPTWTRPCPVPEGCPWFPADVEAWSVRWVLLHLIEETARHAGHADIIRESIDGATMYELMAAVEGWPDTDWLKAWKPAVSGPGWADPVVPGTAGRCTTACRHRGATAGLTTGGSW